MGWADRLLTIVITATVTSAAWIVAAGSGLVPAATVGERATTIGGGGVAAETDTSTEPGDRLLIPVSGVASSSLTDTYKDARSEGARAHEAIDIVAPRGTAVIAAAPGTIERLFQSNDGGNTIYVRSDDRRTVYYYAHLDSYAAGLAEGDRVARGRTLGTVGSTGNASEFAPHLHFAVMRTEPGAEWWDSAGAIDPYPLLTGR
jgi:murein DD-endopeptidase MepM/ murein hydrolase activator NlpD